MNFLVSMTALLYLNAVSVASIPQISPMWLILPTRQQFLV